VALYIEAGWDFAAQGTVAAKLTENVGGTVELTVTTGKYCHTDIKGIGTIATTDYDDFATQLKTRLEAASPNARTYTVTWNRTKTPEAPPGSASTGPYQIGVNTGTFKLEFSNVATPSQGTAMRRVLGFVGDRALAADHRSDMYPYYFLEAVTGAKSLVSDDYEPDGSTTEAHTPSGAHYSSNVTTAILHHDFTIQFEVKAKTHKRNAPAEAVAVRPWTYQHFCEHVRGRYPFLVVDSSESTVHFMRTPHTEFRPRRDSVDSDALWHWPFTTIMEGRL